MKNVQDAFYIIEKLAALSATPGINEDTLTITNKQIQAILSSVVKEEIASLSKLYEKIAYCKLIHGMIFLKK